MTDDEDRTQEIRRDDDRYRSPSGSPGAQGYSSEEQRDDTPAFGRPAAGPPGPAAGGQPGPAPGNYAPAGAYRPVGSAPSYAAPMLPTDRGSGGFPAAVVGSVVAVLVAVGASFGGYQAYRHNVSNSPTTLSGFFVGRLQLVPWPANRGGHFASAFVAGLIIVLIVTLLLMMASTMSTRAGNGGFAVFLAAWMSVVIAAAVANPVASAIWWEGPKPQAWFQNYLVGGAFWGFLFGWIAALVLVMVHALRRKPVTR